MGLTITATAPALFGQSAPIRWGNIDQADLEMSTYSADTEAEAVILGDYQTVEFEARRRLGPILIVTHHRRVKVLNETGYNLGEFRQRFYERDEIMRVRGQTFIPDGTRGGRRVRLESRDVHTERTGDGGRELRFAMPALEPGAIFEYEVRYMTPAFIFMPRWYFQDTVPVRHSEVRYNVPQFFSYNFLRRGRVGISESTVNSAGDLGVTHLSRFVAQNVPAMRPEPFVAAITDHMSWLQPQLSSFRHAEWGNQESFLRTWQDLAQELNQNQHFWPQLGRSRAARELALQSVGAESDPAARARSVYDFVRNAMVWDETYSAMADRNVEQILGSRAGSSGEINMALAALLHEAGIQVEPVLISTRSRGAPIVDYPMLTQFNHLLVLAHIGGEQLLLDATEPALPMGMVPVSSLAGIGWKATNRNQEWIEISAPARTNTMAMIQASVAEDGVVSGNFTMNMGGYHGINARRKIRDRERATEEERAREAAESAFGTENLNVFEVFATNVDEVERPISLVGRFELSDRVEIIGDRVYLTPMLLDRITENPFTSLEREYPVQFAFPYSRTYGAEITLPDGYEVESMPEDRLIHFGEGAIRYVRALTVEDGVLRMQMRMQLQQVEFPPHRYATLREFYDHVVEIEAEPVVLVRTGAAGGTGGTPNEGNE